MKKMKLSQEALREAAECLKVLAHSDRLHIIQLLLERGHTVGEIADRCDIARNVASTHLKLLERCGFLRGVREGRSVTYTVVEKHLKDLMKCLGRRFS